jgi:hypothetical protein
MFKEVYEKYKQHYGNNENNSLNFRRAYNSRYGGEDAFLFAMNLAYAATKSALMNGEDLIYITNELNNRFTFITELVNKPPIANQIAQSPLFFSNLQQGTNINPIPQEKRTDLVPLELESESEDAFDYGPNPIQIPGFEDFPLNDVWQVRHLKMCHEKELDRLMSIGIKLIEIADLYKKSRKKFEAISSQKSYILMKEIANNSKDTLEEIFLKLSNIYDENESLFWNIIQDEDHLVARHGLNEVYDRYKAQVNKSPYSYDSEEDDSFIKVHNAFLKDGDYNFSSEDSENYKDSASGQSDSDLEIMDDFEQSADRPHQAFLG